jgi:hypothetical protein
MPRGKIPAIKQKKTMERYEQKYKEGKPPGARGFHTSEELADFLKWQDRKSKKRED